MNLPLSTIAATLGVLALQACTHGSEAPAAEVALARYARTDLCCSITLFNVQDTTGSASGCGQQASYVLTAEGWTRQGVIMSGPGTPSERLAVCTN